MSTAYGENDVPPVQSTMADPPNRLATVGLVLGIWSLVAFIAGIPAILCSVIAMRRPGRRRKAIIGLVLGIIGTIAVPWLILHGVRDASARASDQCKLKQIGLAMMNIVSATSKKDEESREVSGNLPSAAICDKNGHALLSWRVALLPCLEQQSLYSQFKLDEPWDSENNLKLIPMMPKTYMSRRIEAEPGLTHFKLFVGGGSPFDLNKAANLNQFPDGTSNTIMVVQAADPVVWSKPEDIAYDPRKPLPNLDPTGEGYILVGLCHGSVRTVNLKTLSEKTLRGAITYNGGEILGMDWNP